MAHRANLNIASAVVAKLGTGASDGLIGHVIDQVRASHSLTELASADGMSLVVGAVDTAIARNAETNRPRNDFSAEAARAAQAAGGPDGQRGAGFGYIDAIRANSSARYRDLPASDSNRRSGSAEAAAASGYASAASLNYVGAGNFGGTPFAAVGMNYATFAYVRGQDRALTGQNLLHAVDDAGKLGFAANDKEAIRDHAVIDHYSRDPRHANRALQDYDHRKHDDAELEGLVARAAEEKDAAKRAELNARIEERRAQHRRDSGVQEHIDHDHPKAGAAVRNRANRLDMRDSERATLGRMRKLGTDNVRDADYTDSRTTLSAKERRTAAKAEEAQAASSATKRDAERTADSLSLLAMAGEDATPPAAAKPSSAADAAKPAADKLREQKKAEPTPEGGKGNAKAAAPEKPATPARTRVAGAGGPSVG